MWNPLDGLATVNVKLKALHELAVVPVYASPEAAGADLHSIEHAVINPGETVVISTGIAIELPKGFEAQVRPRSGLAAKHSISLVNSPGTIDSDYRGEIKVIMINHGAGRFDINPGDRIAQLVIVPVFRAQFERIDVDLNETERGAGGLGSTGR